MPANLDKEQQQTVFWATLVLSGVILLVVGYVNLLVLPRLALQEQHVKKKINGSSSSSFKSDSIQNGIATALVIMCLSTTILTGPLTYLSNESNEADAYSPSNLTSSINFCESEFENLQYIAEPANTISSLTSYVPLAVLGALHTDFKERSFLLCYATLLLVGIGSALLHAFLTAITQSGDELPMLWFTAATSYCGFHVIFPSIKGVGLFVAASALVSTAIYVQFRANFAYFHAMFTLYVVTLLFSIIYIALLMNWEARPNGARFKQNVLLPLARACALIFVLASWTWYSEMVGCAYAQSQERGSLVSIIWDRVIHPLWHFTSGLSAFLLIQVFLAADGFSKGRGVPVIACSTWFGAPVVTFPEARINAKKD